MTRAKDQDSFRYDMLSNYNANGKVSSHGTSPFSSRNNPLTRESLAPQRALLCYLALFYSRNFTFEGRG